VSSCVTDCVGHGGGLLCGNSLGSLFRNGRLPGTGIALPRNDQVIVRYSLRLRMAPLLLSGLVISLL